MSANFKPTMSSISDMKPFRFWCQKVLPTVYDDSLSYYELLNKVVLYLNETVDNVDLLNDNVTRLYDAYVLLEGYVNTYFDQEFPLLVEEKLDEMAEDGTLTALIKAYIDPYFETKSDEIDAKFDEQDSDIANALETANLTSARMDNFINQHSGLSGETILYDGEGTPAYTAGSYLSLSDAIADYKYLRIVWIHRQEICVQDFEVIENASPAQNFNLRDTLGVPGVNPPTTKSWEMCQITLIDATSGDVNQLEIGSATVIDNLDYNDGNVDNTMNTGVLKVIGIKDVADTEVVDARVGADSTVYPNLEARLNAENAELKSEITNLTSYNINHKTEISSKLGAFRLVDGVWGFTNAGAFGQGPFVLKKYIAKPFYNYISKAYIYANVCGLTFVDENENVLETVGYDSNQGYSFKAVLISGKAPKNTAYVYVQESDSAHGSLGEYEPVASNELITGLLRQGDGLTPYEHVTGAVAYSGSTLNIQTNGSWAGWITEKYFVYPGEKYTVRSCYTNNQPIGAYVTPTKQLSPIWRDENNTGYSVKVNEVTITIPEGITELWVHRFNTWTIDNSIIYPHLIAQKGVFNEKTWYCIGDSITEYNATATKKYYDFIQEKTGILPVSLAVGGRGYINGGTGDNNRFYEQIVNVPTTADVVTVFGGGNDLTSFDLGNVTDSGTDTICGCINKTIDDLYVNFPLAKLGIITPNPWVSFPTSNDNNKMAKLSDAIVEICRLRGVPCLNLYRCSGMRPWDTTFKSLVYDLSNNDGVHPNNIGHEMMASHIEEFIKSLLM